MAQILLSEWSKRNKISRRTACSWAKSGKIKATSKKVKVRVERLSTVTGYVVDEKTKVPAVGKPSSRARLAKQRKQA